MGVFGDLARTIMNSNPVANHKVTQLSRIHVQRDGSTCSSYELHTNICSINLAPHNTPTVVPNDDTHTIPFTLTAGASVKRGIFVPFL